MTSWFLHFYPDRSFFETHALCQSTSVRLVGLPLEFYRFSVSWQLILLPFGGSCLCLKGGPVLSALLGNAALMDCLENVTKHNKGEWF